MLMQAAEDGAPVVLAEIAMRRALDVDGDPKSHRVVTLDVERRTKLVNSREKDLVEEDRQRALAHADAQRKAKGSSINNSVNSFWTVIFSMR
jgi:hypothetical protein